MEIKIFRFILIKIKSRLFFIEKVTYNDIINPEPLINDSNDQKVSVFIGHQISFTIQGVYVSGV